MAGSTGSLASGSAGPRFDRFQTRVTNGQVEVGPRYSVTNSLEPVRARDPGEFTGGIWNYIYPPRPSVPPPP
jgi:menaquinol-cytochrome c reductase iron-sulfur subunit